MKYEKYLNEELDNLRQLIFNEEGRDVAWEMIKGLNEDYIIEIVLGGKWNHISHYTRIIYQNEYLEIMYDGRQWFYLDVLNSKTRRYCYNTSLTHGYNKQELLKWIKLVLFNK